MRNEIVKGMCSVICVTYNHSQYSEEAIESIFNQDFKNLEIIVVDDGSTDGNVEVVKKKLERCIFPYNLIIQKNSGKVGLNFNRAISMAQGEFLCFLSLDDVLLKDCISSKILIMKSDESIDFVANTSNVVINKFSEVIDPMFISSVHGKRLWTAAQLLENEYQSLGSFYIQGNMFRASIIDEVGGFDENLIGDDIILRTKIFIHMNANLTRKFELLPMPGFAYRMHDDNLHKNMLRQLQTILQWRDTFFPDRDLPIVFNAWAQHYINELLYKRDYSQLYQSLDMHPELRSVYKAHTLTWKYRRRKIKSAIKALFSFNGRNKT